MTVVTGRPVLATDVRRVLREPLDMGRGRPPDTLGVSFKNLEADRILEEIGLEVAASAGAACHADTVEISHVLVAMGLDPAWAKGTVRFSVGRPTTEAEIDRAAEVVCAAVARLAGA
jgi:cysteine desulfurase